MRPSGVELVAAFAEGVTGQGVDVVDLGLASTDLIYFAAGKLDAPGAMFTASHNPAQYNGIKLCLAGAKPVGEDTGLGEIKAMALRGPALAGPAPHGPGERARPARRLRRPRALVRRPVPAPAEGRGRHGQRHGRARRAQGVRRACRSTSRCSTASSTARSRTTPPTPSSPRTSRTCRPACSRPAPTSGWPSTATPTACSSSTSGASRCRARSPPPWWPPACSRSTRARRSCTT